MDQAGAKGLIRACRAEVAGVAQQRLRLRGQGWVRSRHGKRQQTGNDRGGEGRARHRAIGAARQGCAHRNPGGGDVDMVAATGATENAAAEINGGDADHVWISGWKQRRRGRAVIADSGDDDVPFLGKARDGLLQQLAGRTRNRDIDDAGAGFGCPIERGKDRIGVGLGLAAAIDAEDIGGEQACARDKACVIIAVVHTDKDRGYGCAMRGVAPTAGPGKILGEDGAAAQARMGKVNRRVDHGDGGAGAAAIGAQPDLANAGFGAIGFGQDKQMVVVEWRGRDRFAQAIDERAEADIRRRRQAR